jgi:hypothetical protein
VHSNSVIERVGGYSRMVSQVMMRALFPDARHVAERLALIFKNSLIADRLTGD